MTEERHGDADGPGPGGGEGAGGAPAVRPAYRPPSLTESQEAGTLVLRDGSRLPVWRVLPEDVRRIEALFRELSDEEREEVLASVRLEPGELGRLAGELVRAGVAEAFVAEEPGAGDDVVAFGAYRLLEGGRAGAITLAVAPGWRGRGLGRLLLDRLAVLAAHRGVDRLVGVAGTGNRALVDLFRQSGFEVREEPEGGHVILSAGLRSAEPGLRDEPPEAVGRRAFTAASLRPLFFPRSVAVVGASRDPRSVGHRILKGLLRGDFEGTVYPVNPSADQVASVKAYPSTAAIGETVDLAVVSVPARVVREAVESCAEAGVRGLVVVSAGYAETGGEGERRQEELLAFAREHGMRMVGPNCLGLMHTHPHVRMNASFSPVMPPHGAVGLCSQSGAMGIAVVARARSLGLGLSTFVSVGNKADVAADDLLEYWEEDPTTEVLLFYLESFERPRRFARVARRVARSKPVVVVKAGRSEAGERAAGSHTAALSASDTAVEALFRQTGIVRAETLQEMFGIARAVTDQPLPPGRRFAVVTNSGGPAILCADALEAAGLRVEPLSDGTREVLRGFLPAEAAVGNPVDMIASADPAGYRRAVEVLLSAPEVDGLVVIYTPVGVHETEDVEEAVMEGVGAAREAGAGAKPVYASVVGGEEDVLVLSGGGGDSTVPAFPFPEEIGRVAGKLAAYAEWRSQEPGAFPEFPDQALDEARAVCREALEERGDGWLTVSEARRVLELAGLHTSEGAVAPGPEQAVEVADEVGYPVAVKLASTEIVHKTDLGAVKLDLAGPEEVRRAVRDIEETLEAEGRRAAMQGVLVQPMLSGTAEIMMGMSQDPAFGPVLAFGMGGIHVEILRDVAFRVCPLTDRDARQMVREIRGYRLLEGYRGHPAGDVEALEEALLRLSRLVEAVEELEELDLNPVFALQPGQGYRVADARIRVAGG